MNTALIVWRHSLKQALRRGSSAEAMTLLVIKWSAASAAAAVAIILLHILTGSTGEAVLAGSMIEAARRYAVPGLSAMVLLNLIMPPATRSDVAYFRHYPVSILLVAAANRILSLFSIRHLMLLAAWPALLRLAVGRVGPTDVVAAFLLVVYVNAASFALMIAADRVPRVTLLGSALYVVLLAADVCLGHRMSISLFASLTDSGTYLVFHLAGASGLAAASLATYASALRFIRP